MVVNMRFRSQANRRRTSLPKQIVKHNSNLGVQNNLQPPPFPPRGGGDQDRQKSDPPKLSYNGDDRRRGSGGTAISFVGPLDNLNRKVAKLEMRCANMAWEMEKKDNGKATAVDRLLIGTSTLLT
jgi:hypothetical protein